MTVVSSLLLLSGQHNSGPFFYGIIAPMSDEEAKLIAYYLRDLRRQCDILADLAATLKKALIAFEQLQIENTFFRASLEQAAPAALDQIENSQTRKSITGRLPGSIIEETIQSLMVTVSRYQANLNRLKEQEAIFGVNIPINLKNEITITEEKLLETKTQLDYYQEIYEDIEDND